MDFMVADSRSCRVITIETSDTSAHLLDKKCFYAILETKGGVSMRNYSWEQFKAEWRSFIDSPAGMLWKILCGIGVVFVVLVFALIS
jgi:hypothetical protein